MDSVRMAICWERLKCLGEEYIRHCRAHYSLLNYLSFLFKLFILLNYLYFTYMIFSMLWNWLKSCFERNKQCCQSKPTCEPPQKIDPCTCFKPAVNNCPRNVSARRSKSACMTVRKSDSCSGRDDIHTLYSKSKPRSSPCPTEKKESGEKLKAGGSSMERIQVEFNCKPKKTRRTRDSRMLKSRSCTKCGKNLTGTCSKGTSRVPLPYRKSNVHPC